MNPHKLKKILATGSAGLLLCAAPNLYAGSSHTMQFSALGRQVEAREVEVPPALLSKLRSADPAVRRETINDLGGIRARQVAGDLIDLLSDREAGVREAAAFALGQIADRSALNPLLKTLSDRDPAVRASAAFSLGMLGDQKAAPQLVQLLGDGETAVRASAAAALGLMQDEDAAEEVAELLNDPSFDARYDAVWALGQIGSSETIEELRNSLKGLDPAQIDESLKNAYRQVVDNAIESIRSRENEEKAPESPSRPRRARGGEEEDASKISRPITISKAALAATTARAYRASVKGNVEVKVLVSTSGRPVRAYVRRRLGYGLDQRAIESVLQYRFTPRLRSGMVQVEWISIEVRF